MSLSTVLLINDRTNHLPQIRFLMKSYSFVRETAPVVMRNAPEHGTVPAALCGKNVKCVHATGGVIPLRVVVGTVEK